MKVKSKESRPRKEWEDMSAKEKKQTYVVAITILGFIIFWIQQGFLQAIASVLVIYSLYYIYRSIRYKELRKKSILTAIPLMILGMVVAPSTYQENRKNDVVQNNTAAVRASDQKYDAKTKDIDSIPLMDVSGITDGDTLKVSVNGVTQTIRLIGIDTPETKDPDKPVQCYGPEASSQMQHYAQSKKVRLEADPSQGDKDKYGRLLRYVYTEDNINIGKALIQEGYAHEYTYSKPYKYQKEFKDSESTAKTSKKGFWSETACNGDTNQTDPKIIKKEQEEAAASQAAANAAAAAAASAAANASKQQTTQPAPAQNSGGSVYYANCTAVKAAGAAPIYQGQPGYSSKLDRDGDGIACEK